jgi:glucoamylase
MRRLAVLAAGTLLALGASPAAAPAATAPGGPGADALWTEADKDGFGTASTLTSKVWHTLDDGELTEVFYPDIETPAVRDTQFVVSDGRTFAERERDAAVHRVELADPRSLTYRQVNESPNRYRITKTYVADPARDVLLVDVRFESLSGRALNLYVLHDPALSNDGNDDGGSTAGDALLVSDARAGGALVAAPGFRRTSNGYLGTSDGWQDLRSDFKMDWTYDSAPKGNVVQTAETALDGRAGSQRLTLALGFGADRAVAAGAARASLAGGFAAAASAYAAGWHAYVGSLTPAPAFATAYDVSAMTLAAHEDKTHRGAYVASPTMPWVWGTGLERPSGVYHKVWSRDLYQIATGLLAAGDRAGAERALTYLLKVQQKPDGSFPQNSNLNGTEHWTNLQMDQVAFPIVLAWQLGRADGTTYRDDIKKAADFIVANGPFSPQERWENQGGWSPATIASEIAALVCAADLAKRNKDGGSASRYLKVADAWQAAVQGWTATTNGPYSPQPYYLRLTKDAKPNSGTTYNIGDSGPNDVDQRAVVDQSFLELVRLGVKPADDPVIRNTVAVVDQQLAVATPNGTFWHRFNFDGYGEQADGSPWDIGFPPGSQATIGRIWPLFAGERGEYELLAGGPASSRLAAMAAAGNDGYMLPEQVWDEHPPSGRPGFAPGEGTFSATPLAWSHAQFLRLARSIAAGRPVEQPSVVACRYARRC